VFRLLRLLVRLGWPIRLFDPLFGKHNPLHPDFRADPYPHYHRLRREAPVYRHPLFGVWYLSRYDDVLGVLRDPTVSVRRMETKAFQRVFPFQSLGPDMVEVLRSNLLMLDPPDHTRIRNLVNKAFTPRMVERLGPRIRGIVDDLLDAAADAGEIELVRDFASPLPVIVIAEMLGVPVEDRERFKRWSDDMALLLDPISAPEGLPAMRQAFVEFGEYLDAVVEDRRRSPRDDLLSGLVAAEEAGDRLSPVELGSLAGLILAAGHETTTNLIGNAVVALLRNPGERKRLRDDPGLLESAVEEFLRYDSPVQATDRILTRELEIAGRRIPSGEAVVLLLAAANRDPARFPDPDRLDLARPDNRHLAFGQGVHFCLGAHLARVEAQLALGGLLRRFPDLDGDPATVEWRPSMTLRGPVALPLTL
jgi:hypothetical protein